MKLNDLFEEQRVIEGDVELPRETTKLDYHGATIEGYFACAETKIKSLEGAPSYVHNSFFCSETAITSLKGAPSHVGSNFRCYNTRITSLRDVHKHIKYIGGAFFLSYTVKSHVLGVMLIKGLQKIKFIPGNKQQTQAANIINKYLQSNRDIHACQEELLEAGLGAYARL